jgi:hypothetical protein
MILAIRSSRNEAIKIQLSSLLGLSSSHIACSNTNYSGISLLTLSDTSITIEKSIRNIEALQVNESTAQALENPEDTKGMSFLNSLKSIAPVEQFKHLNQLLYTQRNKV